MFRGGGFMNDNNTEQQSEGKKNSMMKDTRLTLILPITIKMLTSSYQLEQELPSDQLMIVGRIIDYKEEDLQILLQICDETAIQEIIIGKKNGQPPVYMQQFQFEPNIYAQITFNKRSYQGSIKCFCQYLKVIKNYSEITRHQTEVVLRYLQRTHGLLPRESEQQTTAKVPQMQVPQIPQTGYGGGYNQQLQGGFGGQVKNQGGGFGNNQQTSYTNGPTINKDSFKVKNQPPQEKVLICMKYIAQQKSDNNIQLYDIQKELTGQMQPQQIAQAVKYLVGQNKIYENGEQDQYVVLD